MVPISHHGAVCPRVLSAGRNSIGFAIKTIVVERVQKNINVAVNFTAADVATGAR